jgi:hypothetical protein
MRTTSAEKQNRRNGDQKKANFQTFAFHEQESIRRETYRFSRTQLTYPLHPLDVPISLA